jgi:ABC-2 type transport system ATP-binding protein
MDNSSLAVLIDQLRVRRGAREVLHGVSLRVPAGAVVGVLGPSGCGKTTLLRAIVGAQIISGGMVSVFGLPAGSRRLRAAIGYATQAPAVYADLRVRENLRYFAAVLRAPAGDVDRVLDLTDLTDHADHLAGQLSGGQRARVNLAIALLGRPRLLVLDEPTVGLDPVLRDRLWRLFHALAADGMTLLVSSHVMDEAARCDRLVLIRDGSVIADERPADLLRRTETTDVEQAFLRLVGGDQRAEASA